MHLAEIFNAPLPFVGLTPKVEVAPNSATKSMKLLHALTAKLPHKYAIDTARLGMNGHSHGVILDIGTIQQIIKPHVAS